MTGIPASEIFTEPARLAVAAAIERAEGVEVFFLGRAAPAGRPQGERLLVVSVEDYCRGNAHMVPVLTRVARGFDVAIHNHPSGNLLPSDPDLHAAALLGDLGLGFFIVDNAVERVNPVVKLPTRLRLVGNPGAHDPFPLPREFHALRDPQPAGGAPGDAAARALATGGPLARRLGAGFEARPEQEHMTRLVAETLAGSGVAAIEAGTGTGKSLAYLVPALLRALEAKERIVVSTNTINLQEQLIRKDIPLVLSAWRGILGGARNEGDSGTGTERSTEEPRAVLMKGRANYACLRKVADLDAAPEELFEDAAERDEVRLLAAWARRSPEGSREELAAPPSHAAWEKVAVDADTCTRTACPLYGDCFYFKARRAASAADLVVVNHHLLMSDLAVRRDAGFSAAAVLPPFRHLVIDEAHHLEDVAAEHFGERLTSAGLRRAVGRLRAARRSDRGLLPALRARLLEPGGRGGPGGREQEALRAIDERALPARAAVDPRIDEAFAAASALVDASLVSFRESCRPGRAPDPDGPRGPAPEREDPLPVTVRIKPEEKRLDEWRRFVSAGGELAAALLLLAASLEAVARPIENEESLEGSTLELKAAAARLEGSAAALKHFLGLGDASQDGPTPREVLWIERRAGRGREPLLALRTAPLDVATVLAEGVYPNLESVVLTSATLAVQGGASGPRSGGLDPGFGYLASRVGLDRLEGDRLRTLRLASPFDYERACVIAVPRDLPDPGAPDFEEASARVLLRAAEASGGRAFFLFTSYRALDRAWRALEAPLARLGIRPLRQGDASRGALVERFRAEAPAVLFATDSFWEGVDVRGGALRLVAIQRLPFKVPSEPLQEARAEAIAAGGGDPFRDLTVPQAILKLKQGFGRLIRSRADRGAILILDRRLLTKAYGRLFLASLPPATICRGSVAEVLPAISRKTRESVESPG